MMNTISLCINLGKVIVWCLTSYQIVHHTVCISWLINLSSHRAQLRKCEKERHKYKSTHEELEKLVKNSQRTAMDFEAQLTDALKAKVCGKLSNE
jgi:hypothetical protein